MKRPNFKTNLTYENLPGFREVNNEPSETVPGQSMSLSEMIERYSHGMSIPVDKRLAYLENEDDIVPIINDLTDIDDYKRDLRIFKEEYIKRKKEAEEAKKNQLQIELDIKEPHPEPNKPNKKQ